MAVESVSETLLKTPLHAAHLAAGARMVSFAGYDMPVQYPLGVLGEHLWTRDKAGLFDVSHMGQAFLTGPDHETTAHALEALIPADIVNLKPGQQRYSQLLDENGGILDDLMVVRPAAEKHAGMLHLVVNAACKAADYAHLRARLPGKVTLHVIDEAALLALQGPKAAEVLDRHAPGAAAMAFMTGAMLRFAGIDMHVTRSGYTGEDGYELGFPAQDAEAVWQALLAEPEVKPIGLGARDSLRLEAGLCLYGHDIDTTTSPIEGALAWSIQKRRRLEGGFPGAGRVQRELAQGPSRLRVGLRPEGRQPAREGAQIVAPDTGAVLGTVTSGGFGPSVNAPVAMGYVPASHAAIGTPVHLIVRGKALPAQVASLPFAPHRYVRAPKS